MSWLSDLAGKAEHMLNRLDQNAAIALQKSDNTVTEPLLEVTWDCKNTNVSVEENILPQSESFVKNDIPYTKSRLNLSKKKQSVDDKLMEYLNDNSNISNILITETADLEGVLVDSNAATDEFISSTNLEEEEPILDVQDLVTEVPESRSFDTETLDATTENIFLKNELSVANNEISRLISKIKSSETDHKKMKLSLADLQSKYDDILTEFKKKEKIDDNTNTIDIKMTYEEPMKDLENKLTLISEERDLLKQKLQSIQHSNVEFKQNYSKLENEVYQLQQVEATMKEKIKHSEKEIESINNEWQQYRNRAQNTLHLKEQLINELKYNGDNKVDHVSDEIQLELKQLRNERDLAHEEVTLANGRHESVRGELRSLQITLQNTQEEFKNMQKNLHDKLINESILRKTVEEDYSMQTEELNSLRQELSKKNGALTKYMQGRDNEINNLRSQITKQSLPSGELEERIHTLTQSLVSKQNALETLTADRNALRLQLEKMENKHRIITSQLRQQSQGINVNDTDDAKAQVPNFLMETPFDTKVARRVKRVYSSLDAVGIRTGVFLRRYPIARILVICYMLLLHLWVMIVLFSYKPN